MKSILKNGICSAVVNLQTPAAMVYDEDDNLMPSITPVTFKLSIEPKDDIVRPVRISAIYLEMPEDISNIMVLPDEVGEDEDYFEYEYNPDTRVLTIISSGGR